MRYGGIYQGIRIVEQKRGNEERRGADLSRRFERDGAMQEKIRERAAVKLPEQSIA